MNRKAFLRSFLPLTIGAMASRKLLAAPINSPLYTDFITSAAMPPYLKEGNTVGITCPAGFVETNNLQSCFKTLRKWGLNVKYGDTVGKRWQRYGGTDAERLRDFQSLLDSDSVDAIIFGKGGYGTMRIIDKINWDKFKQKPKWLVGFSDLTTVHLHIHRNLGIPTIHADMGMGLSTDDAASCSLQDILFGKPVNYSVKGFEMNRAGTASGVLVGGNLSLIQACSGSQSDIDTEGKILFIEDVNEYKYQIDRMLTHLQRSGKLDKLAGLVVGEFSATKEHEEIVYGQSIEEMIWEKVRDYNYPVCFHFPAGHIKNNLALKLGVSYQLSVSKQQVDLKETITSIYQNMPSAKDSVAATILTQ